MQSSGWQPTLCVAWCLIWRFANLEKVWSDITSNVLTESRYHKTTKSQKYYQLAQGYGIPVVFISVVTFVAVVSFLNRVSSQACFMFCHSHLVCDAWCLALSIRWAFTFSMVVILTLFLPPDSMVICSFAVWLGHLGHHVLLYISVAIYFRTLKWKICLIHTKKNAIGRGGLGGGGGGRGRVKMITQKLLGSFAWNFICGEI